MNSNEPLVSIICLCYNHAPYVEDSLQSVLDQNYPKLELIVVDDGSTDESPEIISQFVAKNPQVKFIPLKNNSGNCRAFNTGFRESKGDFIIDLAADDILEPQRVATGVNLFRELSDDYGVIFSDAAWVDKNLQHLYFHSERFPHATVPQGDVYQVLIEKYFICSPTMMFRRTVVDQLKGYDESLTYEDFDFWIRSSREFLYKYDPAVLVKKRKLTNSLSADQYRIRNRHNMSTYRVCEKILALNRSAEEHDALRRRIRYEIRQCIRTLDFTIVGKYMKLLKSVSSSIKKL